MFLDDEEKHFPATGVPGLPGLYSGPLCMMKCPGEAGRVVGKKRELLKLVTHAYPAGVIEESI